MKFSTGCDLEEIKRFESLVLDEHFLKRVYTKEEIKYCLGKADPTSHFTVRWCAKEAVRKAFSGLGVNSLEFPKIEVTNNTDGYPMVYIHDHRCECFETKVSLSHSGGIAMATAIVVEQEKL